MTSELQYLVYSVLLTWVMLMAASLIRTHGWTPRGLMLAFSNRDDMPDPSPLAARADRAARNMLENMVLFIAALFVANASGAHGGDVALGAQIFFYARLAYFFVYLAGIIYLRTLIWAVAIAGIVMILRAAL